jgi:hypothetical protein
LLTRILGAVDAETGLKATSGAGITAAGILNFLHEIKDER